MLMMRERGGFLGCGGIRSGDIGSTATPFISQSNVIEHVLHVARGVQSLVTAEAEVIKEICVMNCHNLTSFRHGSILGAPPGDCGPRTGRTGKER
jgi:predicted sugar kinase